MKSLISVVLSSAGLLAAQSAFAWSAQICNTDGYSPVYVRGEMAYRGTAGSILDELYEYDRVEVTGRSYTAWDEAGTSHRFLSVEYTEGYTVRYGFVAQEFLCREGGRPQPIPQPIPQPRPYPTDACVCRMDNIVVYDDNRNPFPASLNARIGEPVEVLYVRNQVIRRTQWSPEFRRQVSYLKVHFLQPAGNGWIPESTVCFR